MRAIRVLFLMIIPSKTRILRFTVTLVCPLHGHIVGFFSSTGNLQNLKQKTKLITITTTSITTAATTTTTTIQLLSARETRVSDEDHNQPEGGRVASISESDASTI